MARCHTPSARAEGAGLAPDEAGARSVLDLLECGLTPRQAIAIAVLAMSRSVGVPVGKMLDAVERDRRAFPELAECFDELRAAVRKPAP